MTKIYGLYYTPDSGSRVDGNVMYMNSGNTEFFSTELLRDCRADELEKIFKSCHDAEDVIVPEIWSKFDFELDSVNVDTIPKSLLEDLKDSYYDLHNKDGEYILEDLEGSSNVIESVVVAAAGS